MATKTKAKAKQVKKANQKELKKIRQQGFVYGIRGELQKVTWPSRSHVGKASVLVVASMVLATVYVAVSDGFFSKVLLLMKVA